MKLGELITELCHIYDKHGEIDVRIFADHGQTEELVSGVDQQYFVNDYLFDKTELTQYIDETGYMKQDNDKCVIIWGQ